MPKDIIPQSPTLKHPFRVQTFIPFAKYDIIFAMKSILYFQSTSKPSSSEKLGGMTTHGDSPLAISPSLKSKSNRGF